MNKLAVYFRMLDADVIALFPSETADYNGNIMSYMKIGQHGAASPELQHELEPACPELYAELLKELVAIYKPKRVTRSGIFGDAVIFHGVENE